MNPKIITAPLGYIAAAAGAAHVPQPRNPRTLADMPPGYVQRTLFAHLIPPDASSKRDNPPGSTSRGQRRPGLRAWRKLHRRARMRLRKLRGWH